MAAGAMAAARQPPSPPPPATPATPASPPSPHKEGRTKRRGRSAPAGSLVGSLSPPKDGGGGRGSPARSSQSARGGRRRGGRRRSPGGGSGRSSPASSGRGSASPPSSRGSSPRKQGRGRRKSPGKKGRKKRGKSPVVGSVLATRDGGGALVVGLPAFGEQDAAVIRGIFHRVDANGDGELTRSELIKALRKDPELQALLQLPPRIGDDQRGVFERVFQGMDADGGRTIDEAEFVAFVALQRGFAPPVAPQLMFDAEPEPEPEHEPRPLNSRALAALDSIAALPESDWLRSWRSRGGQASQCHRPGPPKADASFLRDQIRELFGEKGPMDTTLWSEAGSGSCVELNLAFCAMGDARLIEIAPLLSLAPISELNLDDNRLCDAGMASLAKGVAGVPVLRVLSLRGNSLTDAGVAALGPALPHRAMEMLDLSGNAAITQPGIDALELAKRPQLGAEGQEKLAEGALRDRVMQAIVARCSCTLPRLYWGM